MANIPVSIGSSYYNDGFYFGAFAMVGGSTYQPPNIQLTEHAWYWLVLDLTNLNVLCNEATTDGTTVPADVQAQMGNPNAFLIFAGNAQWGGNFPQGAVYDTLLKAGALDLLPRMGQMTDQAGTGYFMYFSYLFAGTLAGNDLPGYEEMSLSARCFKEFQFMPITVGGQTVYTPVEQFGESAVSAADAKLGSAARQQAKK